MPPQVQPDNHNDGESLKNKIKKILEALGVSFDNEDIENKIKRILKMLGVGFISVFIALGLLLSFSFLSFTGTLALVTMPHLPHIFAAHIMVFAGLSFVFSGIIEGKIMGTTIIAQIKEMFDVRSVKENLILQALYDDFEKYLDEQEKLKNFNKQQQQNQDAQNNIAQENAEKEGFIYRTFFKKKPAQFSHFPEEFQKKFRQVYAIKEHIERLKKRKIARIFKDAKTEHIQALQHQLYAAETKLLYLFRNNLHRESLRNFDDEAHEKKIRIYILLSIAVLGGVGATFATSSAMQAAAIYVIGHITTHGMMYAITAGVSAGLTGGIWAIAVLAGIGYFASLGYFIYDMVKNDVFRKCFNTFYDLCLRRAGEHRAQHILRVVGVVSIAIFAIALAVFGTIALSGTWWFAVKLGIKMLPFLAKAANAIRLIVIGPIGATQTLFNQLNCIKTAAGLFEEFSLIKLLMLIKDSLANTYRKETLLQFFNPLRFILKIIEAFTLIGIFLYHLTAMGLSSDNVSFGKVTFPKLVAALLGALVELFTDLPNLGAAGNDQEIEKAASSSENQAGEANAPEKNQAGGESHHDHESPIKTIIKWTLFYIPFSPLLVLSALWDWTANEIGRSYYQFKLNKNKIIEDKKPEIIKYLENKEKLGLDNAFRRAFGFKERKRNKEEVPEERKINLSNDENNLNQSEEDKEDDRKIIGLTFEKMEKKYQGRFVINKGVASEKAEALRDIKKKLLSKDATEVANAFKSEKRVSLSQYRFFVGFKKTLLSPPDSKNFLDRVEKSIKTGSVPQPM